jgi:hypothetical protein
MLKTTGIWAALILDRYLKYSFMIYRLLCGVQMIFFSPIFENIMEEKQHTLLLIPLMF